ncbi:hypothetical protein [Okeania sp. SIO2C2]|uniref:hypothetical protein n=1 Tax=Okeania sp. SIO2C2 TaxID=2607787 RepID=UPI00257FD56A|nr:hypothetical protein [Okeania sp. SIO2C2]
MRDLSNVPIHLLNHEHYHQMLVRDGQRRFKEWRTEYLRYRQEFLKDQRRRIRELENLRESIDQYHKRRFRESRREFLRYQNKFLNEMRRY